jgi:hypothetical protein
MATIMNVSQYPWRLNAANPLSVTHVSYHRTYADALREARGLIGYESLVLEKQEHGIYVEKPLRGLRIKGGQTGNKNAAKKGRKRVKFDASLSDKRLAFFEEQAAHEIYAKTEERRLPTDEEIAKVAREMFYAWVDSLM